MLERNGGRLSATVNLADAVAATDITFVIVPTPSDHAGGFSMKFISRRRDDRRRPAGQVDYHLVVLTSTVMPGCTTSKLVPVLEKASGKKVPADFGVCYSPEFIALGSVIRDFLNPDLILIGETDPTAGDRSPAT